MLKQLCIIAILLTASCCSSFSQVLNISNPTGGRIELGDLDIAGDQFTLEALVFPEQVNMSENFYGNVISKHFSPENLNYLLRLGSIEFRTTQGPCLHFFQETYSLFMWYHIAAVYDGTKVIFYKNGCEISRKDWYGNLVTNDLKTYVGQRSGNFNDEGFVGNLDEIRIWNIARTQKQIQDNMENLANPGQQSGLLAYYKFSNNYINSQGNPLWNGSPVGDVSFINEVVQLVKTPNPTFEIQVPSDCRPNTSNGRITIRNSKDFEFSRDSISFQQDSIFNGLRTGSYSIWLRQKGFCKMTKYLVQVGKIQPTTTIQSLVLCVGNSIQVADTLFTTAGTFTRKIKTKQECDSIITTTIIIAIPDTVNLDSTKCRGQTANIGNKTFGNSGFYSEVLKNRFGCDSTVNLNLTIIEPKTGLRSFTVCEGETVADAGKTFASEGSFQTILKATSTGCDSIHTTEIKHIKLRLELQQEPNSKIEYGQTSTLSASFSGQNQTFSWEPKELVECSTCLQTRTRNLTRNTTFSGIFRDTLFNCLSEKQIKVLVNCPIEVPNLVTPNNDNLNDYLYLKDKDCIGKILSLRVFNRWGKQIYSKDNYPEIPETDLWSPIQPGTYYYHLELMEFEGDKRSFKGWIQVIK